MNAEDMTEEQYNATLEGGMKLVEHITQCPNCMWVGVARCATATKLCAETVSDVKELTPAE